MTALPLENLSSNYSHLYQSLVNAKSKLSLSELLLIHTIFCHYEKWKNRRDDRFDLWRFCVLPTSRHIGEFSLEIRTFGVLVYVR